MKKRIVISIISISLVLILVFALFLVSFITNSDYNGLRKISVKQKFDGTPTITLKCIDFSGYKVSAVDSDEKAYQGERLLPINNDLGDFVIKVVLQDADTAKPFREKFSTWTTYALDGSNFTFMYTYTPDHSIAIYIGSNKPIDADKIVIKRF